MRRRSVTLAVLLILLATTKFVALSDQTHRVDVYYTPTCPICREITDQFLPYMQAKHPGLFSINLMDITLPENQVRLIEAEKTFGIKYQSPTLVIGNKVLVGDTQIKAEFESLLLSVSSDTGPPRGIGYKGVGEVLKEKFNTFSFLTITTAGLLDGINPCAFTTIVFFISFLGFAGYARRQIIWIGMFFILAVFLTYLAIGFGLLRFLHTLAIFPILAKALLWFTAGITALLSCFSFRDYWVYRKTGQTQDWTLQLPLSIKQRIHRVISAGYRDAEGKAIQRSLLRLIGTACVTGFIVSGLESVCTGQLYVPTLVYMTRLQETAFAAWGYLLLYNAAFILPLLAVFLLSLVGITSQQFAQWASRHLASVKLGTAIFFLALTVFLIYSIH